MSEDDNDLYWIILGGPMFFIGALAGIGTWMAGGFTQATAWLVEHEILAAAEDAAVAVGAGGLDVPRIVLVVGVLVLLLVGLVAATRSRARRKR